MHFSIGTGMFDVKRLVKYGMTGSLILGTHDGSVDLDCPCLVPPPHTHNPSIPSVFAWYNSDERGGGSASLV